jgi:tRNA (guanine37-N1)-methyltransferase
MQNNLQRKLKVKILTLFPEFFSGLREYSLFQRAFANQILEMELFNIRDFSQNKHKKCDDIPFGGGSGMVMTPEPVRDAIFAARAEHDLVIALSARGILLTHQLIIFLAQRIGFVSSPENPGTPMPHAELDKIPTKWKNALLEKKIDGFVLLCGHYEGIDQRVLDLYCDLELSIGNYILSGGEPGTLVFLDAMCRMLPDFMGNQSSLLEESFEGDLLEYPHFTRPRNFDGLEVPEVLLNGHHRNIENWRREQRLQDTRSRRPDMLK